MNNSTTKIAINEIKFIREKRGYIDIGITKYKKSFNDLIAHINGLLSLNIITENLQSLEEKIEALDFTDYIDVTETIGTLSEDLMAIILEEENPMLPRVKQILKKEEDDIER